MELSDKTALSHPIWQVVGGGQSALIERVLPNPGRAAMPQSKGGTADEIGLQ